MSEMGIETVGLYNGHSDRGFRKNSYSSTTRAVCQCCPYGYHIDLGFVEFCDRLAKENVQPSPSKTERRERRRQRQSMEVLLGLTNPMFWSIHQLLPMEPEIVNFPSPPAAAPPPPLRKSSYVHDSDGLKKAVQDFEATLERATSKTSKNLPGPGVISSPPKVSDNKTLEHVEAKAATDGEDPTSGVTEAAPLQNIREQMALCLVKMKEMESQVKVLPWMEDQLSSLERQRKNLIEQITELKNTLAKKNDELEKYSSEDKARAEIKKNRRNIGILSVPKTREEGTDAKLVITKAASTETASSVQVHKSTATCINTENTVVEETKRISLKDLDRTRETVESLTIKPEQSNATEPSVVLKVTEKRDIGVQSSQIARSIRDVGITAKPKMVDSATEKKSVTRDFGVSDDTISGLLCDRCKTVRTASVGVGYGNVKDPVPSPGVGLANRSKSFDFSNRKHTRSIGISTIPPIKKLTATKQVGTVEVTVMKKNAGVNTASVKTRDAATTVIIEPEKPECEQCKSRDTRIEEKPKTEANEAFTETKKNEKCQPNEVVKKDLIKEISHTSKIPVPTGVKTPVLNRKKFVRQDTYSKTLPIGVSSPISTDTDFRLKPSPEKPELPVEDHIEVTLRKKIPRPEQEPLTEVEQRFSTDLFISDKRESVASTSGAERYSGFFEDGGYDYDEHYDQESNRNSQMFPESALFQPIQEKSREKLVPSKEMKAAMKVVNDGLNKYPNGLPKHLKTASSIIQQEWFKISSTATANPLDVEDYLDNFEEVSSTLLEFVVNMVDNNGNTAMHYAVSHGNFDVVSILLDSKVCNINKANAAGYTCVMLVSLAQVRSDTHRQVVRRLFLLADVNVRAKQHGQTALMLAVSHGRVDMVQLLLEAGADPNIQDCDGSTALMCAAEHGHLEIVKQILAHPDCDPAIVDCDGSSALAIAMEAGNRDIGVLLYAREHFAPSSRGSSPYTSIKQRRTRATSSPHPKTPTSPNPNKKPDHSF